MQDFFLFRSLLDAFAAHGPVMQIAWLVSPVPLLWLALAQHLRLRAETARHMNLPFCVLCEKHKHGDPEPSDLPEPPEPSAPAPERQTHEPAREAVRKTVRPEKGLNAKGHNEKGRNEKGRRKKRR